MQRIVINLENVEGKEQEHRSKRAFYEALELVRLIDSARNQNTVCS